MKKRTGRVCDYRVGGVWALRAVVLLAVVLSAGVSVAAQTTENVTLVSVNGSGNQAGNALSSFAGASADGRFVVFVSQANNLVPNDTNFASDVFVRDLQTNTYALVSINAAGAGPGNDESFAASITPDGRYVVFTSRASDLVANDIASPKEQNVFVRDLLAQQTMLASATLANQGTRDAPSVGGSITPDGRYVIFTSRSNSIVAGDSNSTVADIFRRDMLTGATVQVSRNAANTNGGNQDSSDPAITPDGRYILFASQANDLVAADSNGTAKDFFRRDMQTGTTELVTINSAGTDSGDQGSGAAVISADGQVVAFTSFAKNLVAGDDNSTGVSVYARDFTTHTTALISERQGLPVFGIGFPTAPRISADGRYVIYQRADGQGNAFNVPNARSDKIMRRDRQTGDLLMLPNVRPGLCEVGFNCRTTIANVVTSVDGRYVAYRQSEVPQGSGPPPFSAEIILHDFVGGGSEIVRAYADAGNNGSNVSSLSPSAIVAGGKMVFSSAASHSSLDTNATEDVYLFTPPSGPARIFFARAAFSVSEGSIATFNPIRVHRTGLLMNTTATVNYNTSDGTAVAGSDYTAASGTLTFAPGETLKSIFVGTNADDIVEPDETVNLTLSNPTGGDILGSQSNTLLTILNNDSFRVSFSVSAVSVSETAGSVALTVTLIGGDMRPTVTVNYATANLTASDRSDYTAASGTLSFAPGESTKTINVLLTDDRYREDDETFQVVLLNAAGASLSNPSTATVTVTSDDAADGSNPVRNASFDPAFFVRQHYHDFLNREPDAAGLQFWVGQITECEQRPEAEKQACRETRRVNVSAAFFLSTEFQQTGYLVYRAHQAAFNTGEHLQLRDFLPDTQNIGRGVIIGEPGADQLLEQNRQAFFAEFVTRAPFLALYPLTLTSAQYVDALNANTGGSLSQAERDTLVNGLNGGTLTRAQALRAVAQDDDFRAREFNRAFVLMQYFGYLRRNPSDAPDGNFDGYNFWLGKLNQFGGNFAQAEMVKSFLNAEEYKLRFGP